MKQVSIPIKVENKLNIKASEDLFVEGTDSSILISVVRESDSFRYTEAAGKTEIKATSDCHLQIPAQMMVTIEKVGGDASLSGLQGRVIIGKVGGDLVIQNLGGASIESVGGDLHINNTGDGMEVSRVGGDLFGRQIQTLSTRSVGGDARLLQVSGKVSLTAGGDAELEFNAAQLPEVVVTAGGDIRVVVPKDAQGQLELQSKGESIRVSAAGQQGEWEMEQMSLPLGEGGSLLKITAGGDIVVTDQEALESDFEQVFEDSFNDWKTFGADLEKQIRESIGNSMQNMKWATRSASVSAEKARAKMEKAMSKLGANGVVIDHTGVNVERNGKHVGINFGTPVEKQAKKSGGVSDEERILVLKMLQDKRITAEEADKLLAALDK
jgi:BMFP domain-containing protein YqiC